MMIRELGCLYTKGLKMNGKFYYGDAAVGAANCTDRDGLDALCGLNRGRIKLPRKVYADLGYSGDD